MKKFLGRYLLLIGVTVGCLLLINSICVNSNIYRNVLAQQGTLKFENVPEKIKIANFGSSHGVRGFCYENTDVTAFSFALTAQSLTYDANLLHYYQNNMADGAIILMPISFFSVYWDELKKGDFESQNSRYYTFLDKDHIRMYNAQYGFLTKYCWILTRFPDKIVSDLINSRQEIVPTESSSSVARMSKEQLEAQGLRTWKRHWAYVNHSEDYSCWEEENATALVRMIDLCKDNGFIPVLITTPFLDEYSRHYPPDFLDSFYEYAQEFSDKHRVLYLDYAFDERFRHSPGLFMNSDHLNKDGALKFTQIVTNDLSQKMTSPYLR